MKSFALAALVLLIAAAAVLYVRSTGAAGDSAVPAGDPDASGSQNGGTPPAPPAAELPAAGNGTVPERTPVTSTHAPADCAQGVRGRAVDPTGRPLGGAEAWLLESATNDPMSRMLALHRGVPLPPVARAIAGPDGTFELGIRAPTDKQYELVVGAPHHADARVARLRVIEREWHDVGAVTLSPGTTVRGRVTIEGTDLPVPQATVTVASASTFDDGVPGREGGLSAAVDAAGFYELRNAPRQGLFALTALAPGFARVTKQNIQFPGGAPVQVDFQLPRGLAISGAVTDAAGSPVEGAHVEALHTNEQPFRGADLGQGRFEVPGLRDGNYELRVRAPGFRPHAQSNVPAGRSGIPVVLQRRAAASVRVLSPDGAVLRSYQLAVRRWFAENGGQIAAVPDVPAQRVRLEGAEERATVQGLDDGTYVFQAEADGFAKSLSAPFTISPADVTSAVDLVVSPGGELTGQVVDEAGRPVSGARVETQVDGADDTNAIWRMLASVTPDKITRAAAVTGADGRFRLQRLAHADYQLAIAHADHCAAIRRRVAVTAPGEQDVGRIELFRGAVVRGIARVDGVPAAQVKVVVSSPGPSPTGPPGEQLLVRREAITNNEGRFTLPGRLPPGSYELRAARQTDGEPGTDIFRQLRQMQRSTVTFTLGRGQELSEHELDLDSKI